MKFGVTTLVVFMALATSECSNLRESFAHIFGSRPAPEDQRVPKSTEAEPQDEIKTEKEGNGQAAVIAQSGPAQPQRFPHVSAEEAGLTQEEIDGVDLLVLVPLAQIKDAGGLKFFPRGKSYSATARLEGADLQILGMLSKAASAVSCPPNDTGVSPVHYLVQHTDYGVELSFNWCGAAYNISMQCDIAKRDPRCASNDFILSIYRTLRQVVP